MERKNSLENERTQVKQYHSIYMFNVKTILQTKSAFYDSECNRDTSPDVDVHTCEDRWAGVEYKGSGLWSF